jgi:hypothetical protein
LADGLGKRFLFGAEHCGFDSQHFAGAVIRRCAAPSGRCGVLKICWPEALFQTLENACLKSQPISRIDCDGQSAQMQNCGIGMLNRSFRDDGQVGQHGIYTKY